jgi:hypothetical protein
MEDALANQTKIARLLTLTCVLASGAAVDRAEAPEHACNG